MRFIPPIISQKASNAENKIFEMLHFSSIDGIVFHSLGLSEHRDKVYSEIDFVIISKYGVLCLEVKGGAIEFQEGIWKYYNRYGELNTNTEGPFKQATSGMFSLRDDIKNNPKTNFRISNTLFACGVAFPDTVFNMKGFELIPEIVFDQRNNPEEIDVYLKKAYGYWENKYIEKTGFTPQHLTDTDISLLANILRNDFKITANYKSILENIDSQIIKLTNEQYAVFEALSENDRIIVSGSAGTGKTILGLQYARQAADEGKSVLFLTYNKMLAESLRSKTGGSTLDVSHFHGFLCRYIEASEDQGTSEYFETILPERFLEYVSANEIQLYDMVIIDEAQDLLRDNYLLCIDSIIKGGLEKGKWCILLDPNQNIYNKEFSSCYSLVKTYPHANFKLVTNCRNTKQIGTINSAFHSNYQHPKYMRVEGENVVLHTYKDSGQLQEGLKNTVKDLMKKGIDLCDVVILMPVKYENSSLKGENIFRSICPFNKLTELDFIAPVQNTLRYSTVHSYKGLEAKIIILYDFDMALDKHEMLSYIAISRAKTLLYIFVPDNSLVRIKRFLEQAQATDNVEVEA